MGVVAAVGERGASIWRDRIRFVVSLLLFVAWSNGMAHAEQLNAAPTEVARIEVARVDLARAPGAADLRAELLDPCLGDRWEISTDPAHRAGPWRMVLVGRGGASFHEGVSGSGNRRDVVQDQETVIRPGDRILVEQKTEVLVAHFAAVALERAEIGHRLRVRLISEPLSSGSSNGLVIEVLAAAKGQAQWLPAARSSAGPQFSATATSAPTASSPESFKGNL